MHGLALAPSHTSLSAPALSPEAAGMALAPIPWLLARCNPLGDMFFQDLNVFGPWSMAAATGEAVGAWTCISPPEACLIEVSLVRAENRPTVQAGIRLDGQWSAGAQSLYLDLALSTFMLTALVAC